LFSLPAGGVGLAFGGQFGRETNDQNPGSFQLAGDLVGGGLYVAVHGKRENYAGFAETSIPIFGSNFHAPGFHALEFTAAIRFEEFGNNSSNVMVPKFGLRWQPFDDSLTLRATWGEGYRQPTLVELFAPPIVGPQDVFDPVQGAFVSEVPTTFLPNPNLQPEDSRNFSAGIVYSPNFVPGLTVTVDLFDIETTGWVNPVPDPTLIVERIAAGRGLPGESVTRDANGNLVALTEVTFVNSGSQKARGADFGIVYQLQTSFGTFTSTTQATFLDSFQFASTAGETELELRSSPVDGFSEDAYLKWKGIQRLDWAWRGLGLAATATYRDGFHEFDVNGNEHWVRQTWFFDVQASYEFRFASAHPERTWQRLLDRTSVTVGCTNIFDHDPPRSVDNFPRYIYDPTGRFVYVGLTKKF
jgi:iron complex outermembrane receptor protein